MAATAGNEAAAAIRQLRDWASESRTYCQNYTPWDTSLRGDPPLSEAAVLALCRGAEHALKEQPALLELEGPIKVVGDIRGQFSGLLRLFDFTGWPPEANYLFLGNYIDGGVHDVAALCLLLACKVRWPENFFLLRGKHEDVDFVRQSDFADGCMHVPCPIHLLRYCALNLFRVFAVLLRSSLTYVCCCRHEEISKRNPRRIHHRLRLLANRSVDRREGVLQSRRSVARTD
jgi:Calcineurin-like phosphoesterase